MLFHSIQFLAFFAVAFGAYWWLHRWKAGRLGVLLVASLVFYAAWTPLPILLFAWYAAVNSLSAKALERLQSPRARKGVLALAITSHLGLLCTFKYLDLFLWTSSWAAEKVGVTIRHDPLNLLLPIGLSFIAFQAISYIVDFYRGEVKGGHAYLEQLLYLLFFPQVVAGPIVRSRDLLQRFSIVPTLSAQDGAHGLFRMATGMVKKLLLADVLAVALVDPVFGSPGQYTSAEVAVAVVAYTFQIYLDFSAYSDIAIGAAALFGFRLPENFNKPYLARNVFEFWNRWHISLSTWLRDYLYIPLGGNRAARHRVLLNLMLVMLLGGLWHGASWRFALWGGIHGVLLVSVRMWWWWRGKPNYTPLTATLGLVTTFAFVALTRIFFRAPDMDTAWAVFGQLAHFTGGLANVSTMVWLALGVSIVSHALPHRAYALGLQVFTRTPLLLRAAAFVGLGLVVRQIASFDVQPYIYFQF